MPAQDPDAIAAALDQVCAMSRAEREDLGSRARAHARQFDRLVVFDRVLERVDAHPSPQVADLAG